MTKQFKIILIGLLLSASLWAETPDTLTILTYNIHHGASSTDIFDLDATADVIQKSNASLVALQEVDMNTKRTFSTDISGELGNKTDMNPLFRASMSFNDGYYGNAILSSYPIVSHSKIQLPCTEDHEPRSATAARIALNDADTITFIVTHLDHHSTNSDRVRQAKCILKFARKCKDPLILAGDLNDCPDSRPLRILKRYFTLSSTEHCSNPTYPAVNPQRKIDYIMVHPADAFQIISSKVLQDEKASDHRAYTAKILYLY